MFATTFAVIATRALRGRRSWRAYPKYGIAAVMRAALERRSASTMIISSISVSLVGAHVDCSTKTSLPRTFSSSSTITSPSLNRETVALPSWTFRFFATRCASFGLALPREHHQVVEGHRLSRRGDAFREFWQGRKDSNPRMPESKSGALTNLATPLRYRSTARAADVASSPRAMKPFIVPGSASITRCALSRSSNAAKTHAPEPVMRASPCFRSHARCSRTSGNRATTTGSRSLWNFGPWQLRRKVFYFKGFRVTGQFRSPDRRRGSGPAPAAPGPRTSAGAISRARRRSPMPSAQALAGRRGRRARRRPVPRRSRRSASRLEAGLPQAIRARRARSPHRSCRRPARRRWECASRPRCPRRARVPVASCSSRAARTARSCSARHAGHVVHAAHDAVGAHARSAARSCSVDQREDALQQVVAVRALRPTTCRKRLSLAGAG